MSKNDKNKKEFEVGDIVYLNSNPELCMTVHDIDSQNVVTTMYFDGVEFVKNSFPQEVLTICVNSTFNMIDDEVDTKQLFEEVKRFMNKLIDNI